MYRPLAYHLAGTGRHIMHLVSRVMLFVSFLNLTFFLFNVHDFCVLNLLIGQTAWTLLLPSGSWSHSRSWTRPEPSGDETVHAALNPCSHTELEQLFKL